MSLGTNTPSRPAVNELFQLIGGDIGPMLRMLDPTSADFISQLAIDAEPNGYPHTDAFSTGHIYPLAHLGSNPTTLPNNNPSIGGTDAAPSGGSEVDPGGVFVGTKLTWARNYAGLVFSHDQIKALRFGAGLDLLSYRLEDLQHAKQREANRIHWGDGSGVRAKVQAAASANATSVKVKRFDLSGNRYAGEAGAQTLWQNVPIRFLRGGSSITDSKTHILTRNPTVGAGAGYDTIHLDSGLGAALAEDDEVTLGWDYVNTYGEEPNGILNMHDDGRYYPYYKGVSRASYPGYGQEPVCRLTTSVAEGSAGHLQQLTPKLMWRFGELLYETTGQSDWQFVARPNVWAELPWGGQLHGAGGGVDAEGAAIPVPTESQMVGLGGMSGKFAGGVSMYTQNYSSITADHVSDLWCTPNRVSAMRVGNLKRYVWEDWGEISSDVLQQRDSFFVYWSQRYNHDDDSHGFESGCIERIKVKDNLTPIR